jgi:hypothetical protein
VESIIVPIVVAVIGGPIVVLLSKVRSENTSQHAEARTLLKQVATKVDKVGTKLDEHIGWHKGQQGK